MAPPLSLLTRMTCCRSSASRKSATRRPTRRRSGRRPGASGSGGRRTAVRDSGGESAFQEPDHRIPEASAHEVAVRKTTGRRCQLRDSAKCHVEGQRWPSAHLQTIIHVCMYLTYRLYEGQESTMARAVKNKQDLRSEATRQRLVAAARTVGRAWLRRGRDRGNRPRGRGDSRRAVPPVPRQG